VEVVLAVPTSVILVKDSFRKGLEALATNKALPVPELAVGVDDLLFRLKRLLAPRAHHVLQVHAQPARA
jgi:hypothetical protein